VKLAYQNPMTAIEIGLHKVQRVHALSWVQQMSQLLTAIETDDPS